MALNLFGVTKVGNAQVALGGILLARDDWVADQASCSVLLCRYYEPVAIAWLRRRAKIIEHELEKRKADPREEARL